MRMLPLLLPLLLLALPGCGGGEESTPAEFRFSNDRTAFENEASAVFTFDVRIDEAKTEEVRVQYMTVDGTALAGEDYEATSGTLVFAPGETKQTIEVNIVVDEYLEPDENFVVSLFDPEGGYLRDNLQEAVGTIRNDDENVYLSDAGYTTPESYPGMTLIWSDEFNEPGAPDPSKWTYDLGNGNWGWGNNELQNYTDDASNVVVEDGRLFIYARNEGGGYTSARIKTQGIFDFQYGRVDIRAVVPIGQGIWPALWMLGSDITTEGWPSCGEIDILEVVGHQPRRAHGTAHWGSNNGTHQYWGNGINLDYPATYADEFHVFSIEWQENEVKWLMDDIAFHTITPSDMNGFDYPFNDAFFFIINVAVGGEWPGDPDDTTPFPGFMAVDYIRVFQ